MSVSAGGSGLDDAPAGGMTPPPPSHAEAREAAEVDEASEVDASDAAQAAEVAEAAPQAPAKGEGRLGLSSGLALGALALVPVAFANGLSSAAHLKALVLAVVSGLALLWWGLEVARAKRLVIRAAQTLALVVAFGAWAALSLLWSPQWRVGALDVASLVALAALALVLSAPVGRALRIEDLGRALGVGMLGAGLSGVLELAGVRVFTLVWDAPGATGVFDAAAFGAAFYVVALPLVLSALARATDHVTRALAGLGALAGAAHLGLLAEPWQLGALAGALALGLGARAAWGQGKPVREVGAALVALAIAGGALAMRPPMEPPNTPPSDAVQLPVLDFTQRSARRVGDTAQIRNAAFASERMHSPMSAQDRAITGQVAAALVAERPIVGHGAGGWQYNQTRVLPEDTSLLLTQFVHYAAYKRPHSALWWLLVEQGILGALLLLAWLLVVVLSVSGAWRADAGEGAEAGWGALASVLAGLVMLATLPALALAPVALVLVLSAAWLASRAADGPSVSRWLAPVVLAQPSKLITALAVLVGVAVIVPAAFEAPAAYYRGVGDQLMLRMKYEDARKNYLRAHELYPATAAPLYNAALASFHTNKLEDALPLLDEAIKLHPHDARPHLLRAVAMLRRRYFGESIKAADEAIRLAPNALEARKTRASSLHLNNKFKEAIETLEALIATNPPARYKADAYMQIAQTYAGPLKQPANAIEPYKKALKHMDRPFYRDQIQTQIKELERRLKRERLVREGKPVPKELMPKDEHDHHGHGHGGHGHSHGGHGGKPKLPPGVTPELIQQLKQRRLKLPPGDRSKASPKTVKEAPKAKP